MVIYLVVTAVVIVAVVVGMVLVGRKQGAAWQEFASAVGGQFVKGRLFKSSCVQVMVGGVAVTLDTYSVPSGDSNTTYTRFRAVFDNRNQLELNVRRKGLIGRIDKVLGMLDIDVVDPEFGNSFIVQGKPEPEVQRVLSGISIRQMLMVEKSVHLWAKGDALRLEVMGVVRDPERLKNLFQLFKLALEEVGR